MNILCFLISRLRLEQQECQQILVIVQAQGWSTTEVWLLFPIFRVIT